MTPKKILVIDDEPGLVVALGVRLRAQGYRVISASDGAEGLAAARTEQPDLIFLDIRMPAMDGFEVCRELKENKATASIPVVFLSANLRESAQNQALGIGGVEFLQKPLSPERLEGALQRFLRNDAVSG